MSTRFAMVPYPHLDPLLELFALDTLLKHGGASGALTCGDYCLVQGPCKHVKPMVHARPMQAAQAHGACLGEGLNTLTMLSGKMVFTLASLAMNMPCGSLQC